jgi:hypothetical protein
MIIILRGSEQREYAHRKIDELNLSKIFQVEIKPWKNPRTLDQNALFHGWCKILSDEFGSDFEDTKEALKHKFLPPRYVEMDGETIEVRRSTAKLSAAEMWDLCNRIQAWAASDFGIILPTRMDYHG